MESVLNQNGDGMMMHLSQPMNIKTLLKRKKVMISTPFIGNWIITGSAGYQLSLILKLSEFDLGGTGERRRGEGR